MQMKSTIILTIVFIGVIVSSFILKDIKPFSWTSSLQDSGTVSNGQTVREQSGKEFIIEMTENGFSPRDIEITQGDTVIFKNKGTDKHWPASNIHPTHQVYPEFDPKKSVLPGEEWSFTFYKVGEWRFHDHLYPDFNGSIKVNQGKNSANVSRETLKEESKLGAPDNPKNIDELLAKENMMILAKSDNALRKWLKLAGAKKVMNKLLADSGGGSTIDCHQESHAVGRVAYELYGASVFADGTAACHSGYYHGAMETFLKENGTANLATSIKEVCSKFPTSFGIFECLHGVGHGVVAYKDYDLPDSLKTCRMLATDYDKNSCYGGAFMENVVAAQGLGAVKGHGTRWANNTDPAFPCDKVDQDYNIQYQCYQMQTSWMLTMFNYDFSKVAQECLKVRPDMVSVCFKSYGRDAAGNTLRNPQKIVDLCAKVSRENDYYQQCVVGAVNVIIDFWGGGLKSQATDLCKMVDETGKNQCYSTVAWRLNDIFTSKDQKTAVCNEFEEKYKGLCSKT